MYYAPYAHVTCKMYITDIATYKSAGTNDVTLAEKQWSTRQQIDMFDVQDECWRYIFDKELRTAKNLLHIDTERSKGQ